MSKPYTFQAEFAVDEAFDLGGRLIGGQHGWDELEDAAGIAGCAAKKMAGEPAAAFSAPSEDLSGKSLEELGEMLQAQPAGLGGGALLVWLLPIIREIILRLIQNGIGGGSTSPSPGPV